MSTRLDLIMLLYLQLTLIITIVCVDSNTICIYSMTDDGTHADCSGLGLTTVPDDLPKDIVYLDLSKNKLVPESLTSICEYKKLGQVSIAENHLTRLTPKSLRKCDKVKIFNVSGNIFDEVTKLSLYGLEFTRTIYGLEAHHFQENSFKDMVGLVIFDITLHQDDLPLELFNGKNLTRLTIAIIGAMKIPGQFLNPLASDLKELNLQSTSIERIPANLLLQFTNLQIVKFTFTDLHTIPSALFQNDVHHIKLESIVLSGVKSLPRRVFWGLGGLCHLEIHGAEDIPSDLFDGLLKLENLDLSDTAVRTIPTKWFTDLWSLKKLNLHGTGLTAIKREDFNNLRALEKLILSKNNLRTLDPELFYEISANVKFIDISRNSLKRMPHNIFSTPAALEFLDISYNQISSIEYNAFYPLSGLKRLHLQNNKLRSIESATFVHNVNIVYLDMSSNILIDLPGKLFNGTRTLQVLNLADNLIYNIERSIQFNDIPSVREVNLSYNPIACDCRILTEKDLLSQVSIIGDCEKPRPGISFVDFVETYCQLGSGRSSSTFGIISSTIDAAEPTSTATLPTKSSTTTKTSTHTQTSAPSTTSTATTTLETSSPTTSYSQPYTENDTVRNVSIETLKPTPVSNITLNTEDLVTIIPTDVDVFNTSTDRDVAMTTTGVKNSSESPTFYRNITLLPPKYELGFSNVTGNENAERGSKSDYFYLSLFSILAVAVVSTLILVFLYFKKRRSSQYEVRGRSAFTIYSLDNSINEEEGANSVLSPLRNVPSIQIESVDDDGNVKVEKYSTDEPSDES